ncbi:MAG: hypothetical protein HQK50_14185, partial [Oligoflexia bacterium]|nr:hypothetical protein [Oligoflexia bacterium]
MINWDEMSNLHVIQKLKQILVRWFGVELFYANEHNRLPNSFLDKNYRFQNPFMKIQMGMNYGHEFLNSDVEKVNDSFQAHSSINYSFYDSFFPGIKGVGTRITLEGEHAGSIFAYPFLSEDLTSEEITELKQKLIECGSSELDANMAIQQVHRLNKSEKEYLRELVELVSQEIVTFHHEIEKREARILELNSELGTKYRYHSMIGKSKQMQQIYRLLEKISRSESTVLIQGEN